MRWESSHYLSCTTHHPESWRPHSHFSCSKILGVRTSDGEQQEGCALLLHVIGPLPGRRRGSRQNLGVGWDCQRSTVHGFSQWPGLPWRDASPLRWLAAPPPSGCCILRPIAISALRSRSLALGCARPRAGCGWNAEPVAFPQDAGLMGEPSACTSHSPAKLSLKQARAKVLIP